VRYGCYISLIVLFIITGRINKQKGKFMNLVYNECIIKKQHWGT